jgi:hypothetical protein
VDRLFQEDGGEVEAAGSARRLRDVLCGVHVAEISVLGVLPQPPPAHPGLHVLVEDFKRCRGEGRRHGLFLLSSCSCKDFSARATGKEGRPCRGEDNRGGEEEEQKCHSYALLAQEELEDEEEGPKRSSAHHHGLKIPFQQKKWTIMISSNFIKFGIIRLNSD